MTREKWLDAHAYLRPLAALNAEVEAALDGLPRETPPLPTFEEHFADLGDGVPLFASRGVAVDLEPAGRSARALVERLATQRVSGGFGEEVQRLHAELQRDVPNPRRIADWLLGDDAFAPSAPGLLRYLGWTAAARALAPLVHAFAAWRNDERWLREYCPTCGSPPAMAQLVGTDPGRKRFLVCGGCRTRWQFGRTRCPFCKEDPQRIAVVNVAGQAGLRIDACEVCKAYLKTLEGQADEAFLLADWTSLHLDLLALDRGLKRRAMSLYDLDALLPASA
jgi:FdhE protein